MPWRPLPAPLQARAWPTGNFVTSWSWLSHPCAAVLGTSGPYTIEVCFYMGDTNTTSTYSSPFGLQSTVTTTAGHLFEYNPASGTEPNGVWYNQAASVNFNVGSSKMVISDWNYMAIALDGTTWRPYFRYSLRAPLRAGTTQTTATLAPVDLTGGVNVTLGGELFGPNGMKNGRIVFGRIWNRVLSQAELQLYSGVHLPPGKWRGMVFNYDAQNSDALDSSTGLVETAYGLRSNVSSGNAQRPTAGPQMDSYPEDLGIRNNKWWFVGALAGAQTFNQALSASAASSLLIPKQVQTTKSLSTPGVLSIPRQVQTTKNVSSGSSLSLIKQWQRTFPLSSAGTLSLIKQAQLVHLVGSPVALALVRQLQTTKQLSSATATSLVKLLPLALSGTAASTLSLVASKVFLATLTAASTAALALVKQARFTRSVVATAASSTSVVLGRFYNRVLTAASGGGLTLVRLIAQHYPVTSAGTLSLTKQVGLVRTVGSPAVATVGQLRHFFRALGPSSAAIATLAATGRYARALAVASAGSLSLAKLVGKGVTASTAVVTSLVRQIGLSRATSTLGSARLSKGLTLSRILSLSSPAAPQLSKRLFKTFSASTAASLTLTHALVQFFQRTLAVSSPTVATVAHVYAGIVSLITGYAARLTSSITGAGTGGVATGPPMLSGFTARLVSTIQGWIGYDS
jgi:hypothetical protein